MRKVAITSAILFVIICWSRTITAQETSQAPPQVQATEAPVHFYHLLIVVQEVGPDGKPTNSRSYTATVDTNPDGTATIRTGSRVPIRTGYAPNEAAEKALVNTQWQYVDLGVNIDVSRTREVGRRLSTRIAAEVSSLGTPSDDHLHQPTIRQNKWQGAVLIPLDKPTVVFTSDSLDNKGSMQMVVTARSLQ